MHIYVYAFHVAYTVLTEAKSLARRLTYVFQSMLRIYHLEFVFIGHTPIKFAGEIEKALVVF